MSTVFEDAARYLASVKAGWTDDTINPLELIEVLVNEHADEVHAATCDAVATAEEEHEGRMAELRTELDPENQTVESLLEALAGAIEREAGERVALARKNMDEQIARLTTQAREAAAMLNATANARDFAVRELARVQAMTPPTPAQLDAADPAPTAAKRRARGAAKVPTGTLRSAGGRETKKTLALESAFNLAVEELIKEHGGVLTREFKADTTDASGLMPLDVRSYALATPAGTLHVTPYGNWIAMRFEDADAARALVQYGDLNTYSGKWNHHYDGADFDVAIVHARLALEHATRTKPNTNTLNAAKGTP